MPLPPKPVRAILDELNLDYKRRRGALAITVISVPLPVQTRMEYDADTDILTWSAQLLTCKRERQAFAELLPNPAIASDFEVLGKSMAFGRLLADPLLGPVIQIRWPLCAVNEESLRRAAVLMSDAAWVAAKLRGAIRHHQLDVAPEDLDFHHHDPDWQPDGSRKLQAYKDQANEAWQRLQLDQRLNEIHEALMKDDLRLARTIAKSAGSALPTSI